MELMIAEKIKKYRKERGLTQEALASVLGVSYQSVSKWETGDGYPDITLLPSIANYFEVTVDELIGNDKISAREDVQKNYFDVVGSLGCEERLALALKYNKKYPRNWHIANSLMREISRHNRDKLTEYKALVYELCERILKECPDSVMRRSAVTSACMVCDEDEIEEWISRDTEFYHEKRHEIYEERYKLTGDKEQYEIYRDANNFLYASRMLGRISKSRDYKGNPEKALEWNKAYIRILDAVSGIGENAEIPEGWIPEYTGAYMRVASAYFGIFEKEKGYEYLEKAIELEKRYLKIPDGGEVSLGNEFFFGETKAVKNKYALVLPNGKSLINLLGIRWNKVGVAEIMTAKNGWEWFDTVRGEERYISDLKKAESIE